MTAAEQQDIDSGNDRFVVAGALAGAVTAIVAIVVLSLGSEGPLTPLKAIILGAVEGVTE